MRKLENESMKVESGTHKLESGTMKLENESMKVESGTHKLESRTCKLENKTLKVESWRVFCLFCSWVGRWRGRGFGLMGLLNGYGWDVWASWDAY